MAKKRKESHLTIDSIPSDSHFEFGILSKVVLTFIILSLVPMGLLGLISLEGMDSIGNTSVERSTEALESEANNSLMQFSEDKAAQIDLIFQHYENVLNTTTGYAERVWAGKENFSARPPYYHNEKVSATPPGFYYSEAYGYNLSFDVSCYKLAPRCFGERKDEYLNETETPGFYQNVNATINSTIENGSKLEDILILQKKENPDLTLIYFGTEVGVHRSYPWHAYTSKEYDPVLRGWYTGAKASPDEVYWGTPYIDASGQGLVISGSKVVRDLSTEEKEVIGVVGIDIKITTIREEILGFSVYNTGYSFLIDGEGNTIAHKELQPEEGKDWTDGDLQTLITVYEGQQFAATMDKMILGKSDVDIIERGNSSFFVGYHPIASTGFSFAVVADSEEVLKAVMETEEKISDKQETTMSTIFALIAAAVVFVLVVGLLLARKIVNPLKHLTQTALEVSEGELDQTIHILSKDEIGKLAKAFEKMVAALKKANIMIAREEHKGSDISEGSSQESVRIKARELLGVESSGAGRTETLDQLPGSSVTSGTLAASPFQASPKELPVFAPTAPPDEPSPPPTPPGPPPTFAVGKEEKGYEDEMRTTSEEPQEEDEETVEQKPAPQYFTPPQDIKVTQDLAPSQEEGAERVTETPELFGFNLEKEREKPETKTPFTFSPPPPPPFMSVEPSEEEAKDDVISIEEDQLEDPEADHGEEASGDGEKEQSEKGARTEDGTRQIFGLNLGKETPERGDDELHIPFDNSPSRDKREEKKGDNS